jgi:hypothetical protein
VPKTGRPPKKKSLLFREFCRDIITRPEVLAALEAEAIKNPQFALKLAEHGIGRPFQAVYVGGKVEAEHSVRQVQLADGSAAFTASSPIPDVGIN